MGVIDGDFEAGMRLELSGWPSSRSSGPFLPEGSIVPAGEKMKISTPTRMISKEVGHTVTSPGLPRGSRLADGSSKILTAHSTRTEARRSL